jgi:hypothetical protein
MSELYFVPLTVVPGKAAFIAKFKHRAWQYADHIGTHVENEKGQILYEGNQNIDPGKCGAGIRQGFRGSQGQIRF